jgi:hypothetical protein
MRYGGHWSNSGNAYSLYIIATLLQVPDGLMAAYESQSEEEEMDEICGTLVQSRHCLQAIQAETRLNIQQHRAVSLCGPAHNTVTSVVDPDPGSGIGFFRNPDLGSWIPNLYF